MAKVFDGVSSRAFPEVLLARRAALRAFLVVVMGRFSRGPFRKIFFIFSQPIFLPDLSFFFSLFLAIHFPVFVTFTVFRLPHDTRHPPPPYCTRLLPLSPPTLPPQSWLWCAVGTPPKPPPKRLNSLFVPSCRHSAHVSGAPHTTSYLRLTRDRCPLDPLTPLTCISGLTLFPLPARHTRLDCTFWRSFL